MSQAFHKLAVLCCALLIAAAPTLAEAKAGGSKSFGSRGSRTYDSGGAKPMERSITPPSQTTPQQTAPKPAQPQTAPAASPAASPAGMPQAQPSFFQRSPFVTGILGGLLGASLGHMLFGSGAMAGASGFASMLGSMLQIALIGGLIYMAYRLFMRRRDEQEPVPVGAGNAPGGSPLQDRLYRIGQPAEAAPAPVGAAPGAAPETSVALEQGDFDNFTQMLTDIQSAWSRQDLAALKKLLTPEMLSYFAEELGDNASKGIENKVEDVVLTKGDLRESWSENGRDYVTAYLAWNAKDYSLKDGKVVEGDPAEPVTSEEVWTFVRSQDGGRWLLSAIQQV